VKDRWKDNNVDLSLLSDRIAQFFAKRQFTTSLKGGGNDYVVVAAPKPFHGIAEKIKLHVLGSPDDFSVEFIAGSHSQSLVRYGTLLNLLGGGFFAVKGLKSLEEIEKLEREFWSFLAQVVSQLAKLE